MMKKELTKEFTQEEAYLLNNMTSYEYKEGKKRREIFFLFGIPIVEAFIKDDIVVAHHFFLAVLYAINDKWRDEELPEYLRNGKVEMLTPLPRNEWFKMMIEFLQSCVNKYDSYLDRLKDFTIDEIIGDFDYLNEYAPEIRAQRSVINEFPTDNPHNFARTLFAYFPDMPLYSDHEFDLMEPMPTSEAMEIAIEELDF